MMMMMINLCIYKFPKKKIAIKKSYRAKVGVVNINIGFHSIINHQIGRNIVVSVWSSIRKIVSSNLTIYDYSI